MIADNLWIISSDCSSEYPSALTRAMQRETLTEQGFRLNTYDQLYHRLQELAKNSGEARGSSVIAERPTDIDLPLSIIA